MSYQIAKREWKLAVGDAVIFKDHEHVRLFCGPVWIVKTRLLVYHADFADMFAYGLQKRDDLDARDACLVLSALCVEQHVQEWKPSAYTPQDKHTLTWDCLRGLECQIEALNRKLAEKDEAHAKETFELRQGAARAAKLEERLAAICALVR